jgi:hypothetical protein
MKIILIVMSMLLGPCNRREKEANEKHLSLCKASEHTIVIDYMDSTKGISSTRQSLKNDTLTVRVFVAVGKEQKGHKINLDSNVKYISTGELTYEISNIGICGNVKSGKEALGELERQKK